MPPSRMPGPMPWFKHPIRLLDSDHAHHLSHLLAVAGDPSPEDASRSVVGLLWELAARSSTPGTITTPDAVIESALRKPGVVLMLIESGLAARDDAGLHVAMFAELNERQAAKSASDRERMRAMRRDKVSARVAGLSRDGSGTVARGSKDGRGSDADADADEEKNSSARTGDDMTGGSISPPLQSALAARTDALRDGDPLACGSERPPVQTVDAARSAALRTSEKSLFDDDTTTPAEPEPKRPRKPTKRADGTAPDTRVKPIIEAWDRIYLARFGAPPMVRPNYAQVGQLVRRLDPSMTAEAVTELMDLGLRAASNDTDPFTQRQWSGLTLPDMLSAKRLTMAHALRKSRDEERWQRRHG